ncbi:MAG: hypothetical protein SFW64_04655 [Alphaproteobacteria bacterium]|nr:hypothetical protein [Alphaproteobacteria bacterium]
MRWIQRMTGMLGPYTRYVADSAAAVWPRLAADRVFWLLVAIFTALYLPHAFVVIEDVGLISGYESDPGSHVHAIEDLLRSYNMHEGYHSKFYGWTFFAINFFLLQPIHLFGLIAGSESKFALYFGIRLILFIIGLGSMAAFYVLLRRLFAGVFLPFVGVMLYITSPACYTFFYTIHPESTGLLFLLLGVLALLGFMAKPSDHRAYIVGLAALVLAALSKQIYFFTALPVLFLFFHYYCVSTNMTYRARILTREFRRIFCSTAALAFGILFFIHPFAILQPDQFIKYQQVLGGFVVGEYAQSFDKTLPQWMAVFRGLPLLMLSALLVPCAVLVALRRYAARREAAALLVLVNGLGVAAILALVVVLNRLFITPGYLQPIYPFLIINLLAVVAFAGTLRARWLRASARVAFAYLAILSLGWNLYTMVPRLIDRLEYKDSVAYMSYDYIQKTLTKDDKLAFDHFVAAPSGLKERGCHYWTGCGTDHIEEFAPNYVMFNEQYEVNGKPFKETQRLAQYVREHHLHRVAQFTANGFTVSVFRK